MKRILVIVIVLVLALSIAVPATSITQTMGGPSKASTDDLPVMKPPMELVGEPSIPTGNPHGAPPGQETKPDKPGKPDKEPAANKWAVVVGIADYEGLEFDLWHTDEDAKEMASALINNYGFASGNVKLLLNRKATYQAIVSAIDWLIQNEDAESTVVFFFSGHGFRAADSEDWDNDTELVDGQDEGIVSYDFYGLPDGFLQQKLSTLESQKVALCFGSCHSGGMFDDASDLQGANRVIAAACRADELGWDYFFLGNTLWGKYFVDEGLLQGLADPQGDDSIEEAHAYAFSEVTSERSDSHPQLNDQYDGELIP